MEDFILVLLLQDLIFKQRVNDVFDLQVTGYLSLTSDQRLPFVVVHGCSILKIRFCLLKRLLIELDFEKSLINLMRAKKPKGS